MSYVLVFLAFAVLDFCWARYTKALNENRPVHAANWAATLPVLGAVGVVAYVTDTWMLIPVALGSWSGTYLSLQGRRIIPLVRQLFRMEVPPWRPGFHSQPDYDAARCAAHLRTAK